jgi:hypothetical protein
MGLWFSSSVSACADDKAFALVQKSDRNIAAPGVG